MSSKIKTVGDLMDALATYKRDTKVVGSFYVSAITDAGSDLGGDEEHSIRAVTDLENRIVIEINTYE